MKEVDEEENIENINEEDDKQANSARLSKATGDLEMEEEEEKKVRENILKLYRDQLTLMRKVKKVIKDLARLRRFKIETLSLKFSKTPNTLCLLMAGSEFKYLKVT